MKRKRFTEEQIVRILKEAETIGNAAEVCRRENIAEQTFYMWSSTILTARSLCSLGYRFCVFMAPSSQMMEPPGKSG